MPWTKAELTEEEYDRLKDIRDGEELNLAEATAKMVRIGMGVYESGDPVWRDVE